VFDGMKKYGIYGLGFVTLIGIVVMIFTISTGNPPRSSQSDDVALWTPANGLFQPGANEPVVLWKEETRIVYAQSNRLYYQSGGMPKEELHAWSESVPSAVWRNGEILLIGSQRTAGAEAEGHRGRWLAVTMASKPVSAEPRDLFFGPQEVLTMTFAAEPSLFFAKVRNGTSFSEYVYDSSRNDWIAVNEAQLLHEARDVPSQDEHPKTFLSERKFQLPDDVTVYSYADNGGSVVYFQKPFYLVWRYQGFDMTDAKRMKVGDEELILGRFKNKVGQEIVSFPNWGSASALPLATQLWEDGWEALDKRSFTRVSDDKLEVLAFKEEASLIDNAPRYMHVPTAGRSPVGSHGHVLEYKHGDVTSYISFYDILHAEGARVESLWASALTDFSIQEGVREFDYESQESVTLDIPAMSAYPNTNARVPEELIAAVGERHEEIDYSYAYTYRTFGDRWYVAVDRQFYEYADNELRKLGELPITVNAMIGEGFSGYGAEDFLKVGDDWYVADTQGSRVLKLNARLEIVEELSVPYPYAIEAREDELAIYAAASTIVTDRCLKALREAPLPYASIADRPLQQTPFHPDSVYRDKETGLTWYYWQGRVHQLRQSKELHRSFYAGQVVNAHAHPRFIPYGDDILLLLDHQLVTFDREGAWKTTISFPRSEPDGIYSQTTVGENSVVFDEKEGVIYLVQGYRVLAIDMKQGKADTVFRQNFADLGDLVAYEGTLYFTLQSDLNERFKLQQGEPGTRKTYTELIALNTDTLEHKRYVVEGNFYTLQVEASDAPALVLWSHHRPWYSTKNGTYMRIPLPMGEG